MLNRKRYRVGKEGKASQVDAICVENTTTTSTKNVQPFVLGCQKNTRF